MIVRVLLVILLAFIILIVLIPLFLGGVGFDIIPSAGGLGGRGENYLLVRSTDDGKVWDAPIFKKERRGRTPGAILDIAFHPNDSKVLFAGARGAGLWKSEDDGANWRQVIDRSGGLETRADVYKIGISRSRPEVMYLAAYQGGRGRVLKSEDGGASFKQIYFIGRERVPVFDLYTPPLNPDEVTAATGEGHLLETRDGGEKWRFAGVFREPITLFVVSPSSGAERYVVTGRGGLFKTFDGGRTWTDLEREGRVVGRTTISRGPISRTSAGETEIRSPYEGLRFFSFGFTDRTVRPSMAIDPYNTSVLYRAGPGGVLTSLDGGFLWTALSTFIDGLGVPIGGVATHPTRAETILVTAGQALYTSEDRGVNWKITPLAGRRPLAEIFIHPLKPEIMFITAGR